MFDYDYIEKETQKYINGLDNIQESIDSRELFDKVNEIVQEANKSAPEGWLLESDECESDENVLDYFSVVYYENVDIDFRMLPEIKILKDRTVLVF